MNDVKFAIDTVQRWLGPIMVGRKRRFVVLAFGRTGSNFLCRMLNLQADIVCAGEIFNQRAEHFFRGSDFAKHISRTKEYRDNHPKEFLWRFWTFDTGGACLGFKLLLQQNSKAIDEIVADRSVKKIILSRRNRVKRFVSQRVADKTKSWIKFDNQPKPQVQVTIDPEQLIEKVRRVDERYEKVRRRLIESNQDFKELYYEDLVGEGKIEYLSSVAEYLGCRKIDTNCWSEDAIHKQNSDKLIDIVENYEELQAALKGTELEQFLD